MKLLTSLIILFAALIVASFAAEGAEAPGRPPGVTAPEWIAISDNFGLVVVSRSNTPEVPVTSQGLVLTRPVEGFFMLKGSMGWRRVVVAEPVIDREQAR